MSLLQKIKELLSAKPQHKACTEGAVLKETDRPWQVNMRTDFGPLSLSLFFFAPFSFSVLSLSDTSTSTQSPTFCPSTSSLLSLPPNGLICPPLGLSHPYIDLTQDILGITTSQETTCCISALHYLLQTRKTSFNRQTPSPSPSSCFLNLRWRHLETNLIRWLTGSWFLELLRGSPGSHSTEEATSQWG